MKNMISAVDKLHKINDYQCHFFYERRYIVLRVPQPSKLWDTDKDIDISTEAEREKRRAKKTQTTSRDPDGAQPHQTFDCVIKPTTLRGDPNK